MPTYLLDAVASLILAVLLLGAVRIPARYPPDMPDGLKYFRAESNRQLVTPRMVSRGEYLGDRLRIATDLTLLEWLLLKTGTKK